jgi:hypothetical protein
VPIISICCPAIAEAAIAHLFYFSTLRICAERNLVPLSSQHTNRAGIAIGGRDFFVQSCLSPERRWDNPGPITCRYIFSSVRRISNSSCFKSSAPPASLRFSIADFVIAPALQPQPASSSKPQKPCLYQLRGTHLLPIGPLKNGS